MVTFTVIHGNGDAIMETVVETVKDVTLQAHIAKASNVSNSKFKGFQEPSPSSIFITRTKDTAVSGKRNCSELSVSELQESPA